jgi:hypothetical protein
MEAYEKLVEEQKQKKVAEMAAEGAMEWASKINI